MASFEHDPDADAYDPVGIEVRSVIFPQDFLPDRSSEWARLHFAGRKRGFELVVGRMIGIAEGAEAHERPSFDGLRKAPSIWLCGYFEMRARLDADELTHALDRDPELANALGWASERGRYPGLVEDRVSACYAVLPWAFTQHAIRAFDAGAKKLEFDIDVCLQANGRASKILHLFAKKLTSAGWPFAVQARGASSGGTAIYGVSSGWLHDAVNATATRLRAYRQRTETTPESALQTLSRNRMRKLCSVNGGNRR
jgi:hypothetical protein